MIIDYNFFGFEFGGCIWDTPICTDRIDELEMREGVYDEAFINLDVTLPSDTVKPTNWSLTTIMDAKFTGDLDAGSVNADGFKVTQIQLYRTVVGSTTWEAVAQFGFDPEYNVYDYVDRYAQNGVEYQYAIVPIAGNVQGDRLISDTVLSEFEGIFLTDSRENRALEYDIELGEIAYNTNSSVNQPINSPYPIVVFGNSKYRTGNLSVLTLSEDTINGNGINKFAEQVVRQEWINFVNNGRAKVLRMDNGLTMLVVTQNPKITHKEGMLRDLASISFDYVEIGELDFNMLVKNDLIPAVYLQKMTYDDDGGIISG